MKTVITSEYEALFRQHFRLATLYAERIVGSAHEAEDIVQEVFIALLDVDFSQIRQKESYLYRCVRNAALDHLHARMKNRFYDINSKETVRLAAEENAPGDEQAMIEQIAAIYRRIEALPEQGRRIFKMICIEQLTPGVRGAVLTLSSGENVALEAGGRRMLVEQDGTRLEIAGEELAYHKVEAEQEIPMTNTVTVPRGKEFSLRLSDGTQVWLNSESSLVFPVRFGDGPREVTVTGEAYFDVAHDASRRFVVHADTVSVSVYGTAFNISSYADEGTIETTLVRGSVEVRSGHRRAMLQPGQQARVGREGAIFDVRQVAAEDYAAWTRGLFTFNDETIASICRKLSRWYGVEIVPRGVDADKVRYTGVVKRYETFAEMARLLARTDQIRADVEEGKIVLCIDRDDD